MIKQFYTLMAAFQYNSGDAGINTPAASSEATVTWAAPKDFSSSSEGFLSANSVENEIPAITQIPDSYASVTEPMEEKINLQD